MKNTPQDFSQIVLLWYEEHGRKHLPWQQNITPYRVWISEIMLQQTQVNTVIPYYERFMESFPNVQKLAQATQDEVLHHWTGLGYYARARNLHACAKIICDKYQKNFPRSVDELNQLPGIGRSTAGAIASISMDIQAPILDGNVKRVLTRFFAIEGWPGKTLVEKELWKIATQLTPNQDHQKYTQAMMDLGAIICTRTKPACGICPLQPNCLGYKTGHPVQFPHSKPKKSKPSKQTKMLLIENPENPEEYLLLQRPQSGIWGGLWSFPEIQPDLDVEQWIENQLASKVKHKEELSSFRHTFSHYHLDITPIRIQLTTQINKVREAADHWYNINAPSQIGLAAPVKTLLEQMLIRKAKHQ